MGLLILAGLAFWAARAVPAGLGWIKALCLVLGIGGELWAMWMLVLPGLRRSWGLRLHRRARRDGMIGHRRPDE